LRGIDATTEHVSDWGAPKVVKQLSAIGRGNVLSVPFPLTLWALAFGIQFYVALAAVEGTQPVQHTRPLPRIAKVTDLLTVKVENPRSLGDGTPPLDNLGYLTRDRDRARLASLASTARRRTVSLSVRDHSSDLISPDRIPVT